MASPFEGLFDVGSCTLNTLHGARVDQMLTPDGMVKIITPEAPATFVPPEDLQTPGAVQGIVRAKRVFEYGTGDGSSQTIQEYREVCPCELFDTVAEAGAVELTRGLNWFAQMATTVMQCHAHHLLHGQLRPEHALLDAEDNPKLVGFEPLSWRQLRRGASRGAEHALRPVHHLDAPELHGRSHATGSELQAADVWALGVLGVAIFAGRPPLVTGLGTVELPLGMQGVPTAVISMLTAMLNASPADRPAMPEVVSRALTLRAQGDSLATTEVHLSSLVDCRWGGIEMARTDSKLSELSDAPTRPPSLTMMDPTAASSPRLATLQAKLRTLQVLTARPPLDA
uniref:Protein kinase domain-containing protein n=1 Tax=Phaeocystis antarctica TaxID=33657 RepID=A0A7S0HCG5_9EUKA